jgi:hypothetical protein
MYNVNEIKKFIHEREKGRLLIYEEILEKCYHRIQSSVIRDDPFSLYVVPDFIIGKPTYNFANCIQYIIFRLKNNGFKVKYIYPNALQIEWGKNDFNTMLSIENDRGALQRLAIDNKPNTSPSLFDLKIPHKGDKMGEIIVPPIKKTLDLDLGLQKPPANDIIFKFKDQNKESRKKQLQDEKFRAINTFIPKTNIFTK